MLTRTAPSKNPSGTLLLTVPLKKKGSVTACVAFNNETEGNREEISPTCINLQNDFQLIPIVLGSVYCAITRKTFVKEASLFTQFSLKRVRLLEKYSACFFNLFFKFIFKGGYPII